jgi:hypothetical protein
MKKYRGLPYRQGVKRNILDQLGIARLDLSWAAAELNLWELIAQKEAMSPQDIHGLISSTRDDLREISDRISRMEQQVKQTNQNHKKRRNRGPW